MYRDTPHGLVITAFNHNVIACDPASGRTVWHARVAGAPLRIHVSETRVVAVGVKLYVLDYATGQLVFQLDVPGTTLLVVGDRAYVSMSGQLTCVSLDERCVLWKNELPGTGYGTAAIAVLGASAQGDAS